MKYKLHKFTFHLLILVLTIAIGFGMKFYQGPFSNFISNSLSSIPYIFFFSYLAHIVFPSARLIKIICIVLLTTSIIEITQLYQAEWINHLRSNILIRSLIGNSFSPNDFLVYFIGGVVSYFVIRFIEVSR